MSRIYPSLIARIVTGSVACLVSCLLLIPKSAECESQVHISKKFIPNPHNWKSVNRVAILPIEHSFGAKAATKSRKSSSQGRDFPSDSALKPLLTEMRRRIQSLDSSIIVFTVGKPVTELPASEFAKVVGNISRADAVLSVEVTAVEYTEAKPERFAGYAGTVQLPPIAARPASTRVKMAFTMKDAKYGEIIWQIHATGKQTADAAGEETAEADPPQLEGLLKEMIIAAGSWLPFGEVPPE